MSIGISSRQKSRAKQTVPLREQLGYLGDPQVAEILGIQVLTLQNRRSKGDAPISAKVGAHHLTRIEDLQAYVARCRNSRAAA